MEDNLSIINKTKMAIPSLDFLRAKNDVLGKDYSLSLAFISKEQMKKINKQYRNKNSPTNILSFPLTKNSGEILICGAVLKSELKKFNKTFKQLLGFLFIHGMLHLKGMEHGPKMEKMEEKYLSHTKF